MRFDVRRVAHHQVDAHHGARPERAPADRPRSPRRRGRVARRSRAPSRPLPADRSIASTRASGRSSWAIASATAPAPVPTSTTTATATSIKARAPLDQDLRLRPRDEHAGPDDRASIRRNACSPGQVLERRSDASLAERTSEPLGLRGGEALGPRVHAGPVGSQHVGQEDLGCGQRALHVVARQVVGRRSTRTRLSAGRTGQLVFRRRRELVRSLRRPEQGSTNSSSASPPVSTSCSRCEVCLMR